MTRRDVGAEWLTHGMSTETPTLEAMKEEIQGLRAELERKNAEIERLQHRLDQLCRHVFGRRAEQVDPNQLKLAFAMLQAQDEAAAAFAAAVPVGTVAARRSGHGRRRLPDDLPRERIEIHPLPEERRCKECGGEMRPMKGAELVTKLYDFKPASFFIREYVRVKYSCAHHEESGVVCPSLPPMPIVKGGVGPGLLAHVVTSRFSDHLPFNRLEAIFKRHGVEIARSTMCDWMGEVEFSLRPIYNEIVRQVLASFVIQTDDTKVCVVDQQEGGSSQGHYWAYRGERGSVVYDYTPTRSGEGPARFLEGFKGYLQADAFAGYDRLYATGDVVEVACMAHVRRKFFEAKDTEPKALEAVNRIGELYKIEQDAKEAGLDHVARREVRRDHSAPRLAAFRQWLNAEAESARPSSPFGLALGYARNLGDALGRYLEDGRLDIDNNAVERCMRHVAIGRKNWEHIQGDEAARRNAVLFSLVMSCREFQLDTFAYFRDVIERVSTHPASRIAELTPRYWKPPQPTPSR